MILVSESLALQLRRGVIFFEKNYIIPAGFGKRSQFL